MKSLFLTTALLPSNFKKDKQNEKQVIIAENRQEQKFKLKKVQFSSHPALTKNRRLNKVAKRKNKAFNKKKSINRKVSIVEFNSINKDLREYKNEYEIQNKLQFSKYNKLDKELEKKKKYIVFTAKSRGGSYSIL